MNDFINTIWGEGEKLNALQMSVRALIMFLIALTLIRLGGLRDAVSGLRRHERLSKRCGGVSLGKAGV